MKTVLFGLAWVSFALGAIGAFLPVIPTTPFLILSAFLFSKSSPRFHAWLLSLPFAGPALKDWNENKVVRPRAKVLCTVMIFLSLFFLWKFTAAHNAVKGTITIILCLVLSYVLSRRSGSGPTL